MVKNKGAQGPFIFVLNQIPGKIIRDDFFRNHPEM